MFNTVKTEKGSDLIAPADLTSIRGANCFVVIFWSFCQNSFVCIDITVCDLVHDAETVFLIFFYEI